MSPYLSNTTDNWSTGAFITIDTTSTASTTANITWAFQQGVVGGYNPGVQVDPGPPQRRQPPRDFNRFINASDLLEEFIAWLGTEGIRQAEVMTLPLDLFIKWLIIRACEQDGEEPNVTLALPPPRTQPRCHGCQRFMAKGTALPMHDRRCADFYYSRQPEKVPA